MNTERADAAKTASSGPGGEVGSRYAALEAVALAWPEVERSTSYGTPALKVRGKLMVRLKEDGETVVLRTTWEERERRIALHPEAFFVTDHYRAHPWVLLRLAAGRAPFVADAVEHAWRCAAPRSLVARRERERPPGRQG